MKNLERIVYSLSVEDIQNVAQETLDRTLTEREIRLVGEAIPNYINWFDAIEFAIQQHNLKPKTRK